MKQAQNAMLFLGQIPHPQSGQPEVNLDVAKMFIDQLAMIREKTRGNLSSDEAGILGNTISNLQMAFVEMSQKQAGGKSTAIPASPEHEPEPAPAAPATGEGQPAAAQEPAQPGAAAEESKKKFSKSYGS